MARPRREQEREAKSALMYFESCQTLCVVPLKYVKEVNAKQEGDWVMVFLPQEKHKGDQRAQIVKISGMVISFFLYILINPVAMLHLHILHRFH